MYSNWKGMEKNTCLYSLGKGSVLFAKLNVPALPFLSVTKCGNKKTFAGQAEFVQRTGPCFLLVLMNRNK